MYTLLYYWSYEYFSAFLQCVCARGWVGEYCQYVGDACQIKPNSCLNGATCIATNQPTSPPQYSCKCPLGFTGEISLFYYLFLFLFSESVHLSPGNRLLSPNLYTQLWNAGYGMRNDWFLNLNVWGKSDVKLAEADRYMVLTFLDILLYKHQPKSRHTKPRSAIVFWIFYYFKIANPQSTCKTFDMELSC